MLLKSIIKKAIPNFLFLLFVKYENKRLEKKNYKKEYIKWLNAERKIPAPFTVKVYLINKLTTKYKCNILVETGTFKGEMIDAQLNNFDHLYTIELSKDLFLEAKNKFKDVKKVTLIQGDSSQMLKTIINNLTDNTLFWLDGHYSGGITAMGDKICPIFEELEIIFQTKRKFTILIDDYRLFNGNGGYPTVNELKEFINATGIQYKFKVIVDIILIKII
jgi:hypothetical protein